MSNLDYIASVPYDPDGFMDGLLCEVAAELGYDINNITEEELTEVWWFVYGSD